MTLEQFDNLEPGDKFRSLGVSYRVDRVGLVGGHKEIKAIAYLQRPAYSIYQRSDSTIIIKAVLRT
jgi:hypothetical protein